MIARALPLTACLIWLACESHFSMSFFVATVQSGMASIADGLATVMVAEYPSAMRTASVTE